MSVDDADSALQIIESGRQRVLSRLRDAIEDQVRARPDLATIDPATVDALAEQAAARAESSLWRISLAEAAADHYGLSVRDALRHPTVSAAEQLIGTDPAPDVADDALPADAQWLAAAPATADEPDMYIPPGYEEDLAAAGGEPIGEPDPWAAPAAPEPVSEIEVDAWGAPIEETPQPVVPEPEPEPVVPAPDPTPAVPEPEPDPAPAPAPAPEPVVPEPDPTPAVPEPAPAPAPQAVRIAAVHTSGIESLKAGDKDIELRLSDAGLDVLKRSSGIAIGRLDWREITAVEVGQGKRGRRRRKSKSQSLQVSTGGGQASFELVGLSPEEIEEHVEPLLARLRESGTLAS